MDEATAAAIARGGVIDITTTGRRSGLPRRTEIYFHTFDGEHYITGSPGRDRDWLANMTTNNHFVIHLKREVLADLGALATVITDPEVRREIMLRAMTESWNFDETRVTEIDEWVAGAPLVRFTVG